MSDVSGFSLLAAVLLSLRNKRRTEDPGMDAGEEGPVHSQQANNRKQQTDGQTNQEQTTESSEQTDKTRGWEEDE